MTWKVGQKLAVQIPGGSTIAVAAPPGQTPGSSFTIGLGAPQKVGRTQLMMAQVLHPHLKQIGKPLTKLKNFLHSDLTSYSSMLAYERKLRLAMGHIKNTWSQSRNQILRKCFSSSSHHIICLGFEEMGGLRGTLYDLQAVVWAQAPVLSHRMCLLISIRKSTPPQNRRLIVYYY